MTDDADDPDNISWTDSERRIINAPDYQLEDLLESDDTGVVLVAREGDVVTPIVAPDELEQTRLDHVRVREMGQVILAIGAGIVLMYVVARAIQLSGE